MDKLNQTIGGNCIVPALSSSSKACLIPNIGVRISKANRQVRIQDLDRVYDDILMQGDDVSKFLEELKQATRAMPDVPIKDALVILTSTYVAENWS